MMRKLTLVVLTTVFAALAYRFLFVAPEAMEVVGPAPTVIYPSVPLDGATGVKRIQWSPSGTYILIEIGTRVPGTDEHDGDVVILDLTKQLPNCRLRSPHYAAWGDDDRVWIWSDNDWLVYPPPFTDANLIRSGYGKRSDQPYDTNPWDFDPHARRLVVASVVDESDAWHVDMFEKGQPLFALTVTPKHANGYQRMAAVKLSPCGRWCSLTFSGWIGYEEPGPEEFWLIDIPQRSVSYVRDGRQWPPWQLWDRPTQHLGIAWAASGRSVIFGDNEFGIEEFTLPQGGLRTVAGKRTGGDRVQLSPTGKWLDLQRWPGERDSPDQYDRCFAVMTIDGRKTMNLSRKFSTWPRIWADWHPTRDLLAVLCQRPSGDPCGTSPVDSCDLLYWDFQDVASAFHPNQH